MECFHILAPEDLDTVTGVLVNTSYALCMTARCCAQLFVWGVKSTFSHMNETNHIKLNVDGTKTHSSSKHTQLNAELLARY